MVTNQPFRIVVDDKKVMAWLQKMPSQIRKRGKEGLRQFGKHAVERILQQARIEGIKQFRRNRSMFTSTRYIQKDNYGYIQMPKSGLYQDRAKPHWVSVTRNKPLLYAWAKQRGFTGGSFYFTPKPFIKQGLRNARKRLMPIMRPQIQAAIRESH